MGRVSRLLKRSWVRSWLGGSGSWKRIPINLYRCDNTLFEEDKPGEYRMLAYPRSMTACVSKRCSIGWSPSSSRYSMMPALDIDETIDEGRTAQDLEEIQSGSEWIVDADLRDFFGSVDHEKLLSW